MRIYKAFLASFLISFCLPITLVTLMDGERDYIRDTYGGISFSTYFILGLVFFFISFPLFYWAIKVSDKKQAEKEMREKEQQETNRLIREMLEQKRAEQSSGSNNNQ